MSDAAEKERAAILRLLQEHLDAYPEDVFADQVSHALRWKLGRVILEVEQGRHREED